MAAFRVVGRKTPDDGAAPIMPDPDGLLVSQPVEKLEHVGHGVGERVVFVARIDGRAAIAAHIRCYRAKAEARKAWQLMTPADRKLRPAMHEDDRRRGFIAARKEERRVAR